MKTIILLFLLGITLISVTESKEVKAKINTTIITEKEQPLEIESWMLNDTIFFPKDSIK